VPFPAATVVCGGAAAQFVEGRVQPEYAVDKPDTSFFDCRAIKLVFELEKPAVEFARPPQGPREVKMKGISIANGEAVLTLQFERALPPANIMFDPESPDPSGIGVQVGRGYVGRSFLHPRIRAVRSAPGCFPGRTGSLNGDDH
jgi:hypothetical protein